MINGANLKTFHPKLGEGMFAEVDALVLPYFYLKIINIAFDIFFIY
jgi:hypothetical protein